MIHPIQDSEISKLLGECGFKLLKRSACSLQRPVGQTRILFCRIVILALEGQFLPCIVQAVEDFLVEQLVPQAAFDGEDIPLPRMDRKLVPHCEMGIP